MKYPTVIYDNNIDDFQNYIHSYNYVLWYMTSPSSNDNLSSKLGLGGYTNGWSIYSGWYNVPSNLNNLSKGVPTNSGCPNLSAIYGILSS